MHLDDNTQGICCRREESSYPGMFAQSVQYLSEALAIPKITNSFITKVLHSRGCELKTYTPVSLVILYTKIGLAPNMLPFAIVCSHRTNA